LIQAIRAGHLACVQVLLHYGADETIRDMVSELPSDSFSPSHLLFLCQTNLSPYDIASDDIRPFLNPGNSTYASAKQAILADDETKLRSLLKDNPKLLNEQDEVVKISLSVLVTSLPSPSLIAWVNFAHVRCCERSRKMCQGVDLPSS
jgi:hypothetical protein